MKKRIVQTQFMRRESKYILDKATLALFEKEMAQYMVADDYAQSTITNIYFDNTDFEVIQDALDKQNEREKIRMRVYDAKPTARSQAFLEIKKKVDGVGYKYRLTSSPQTVTNYIEHGMADTSITDPQVTSELQLLRHRYGQIQPMMYIYYDRSSYKSSDDSNVRLTIDQNLLYRDWDVAVNKGKYGQPLLEKNKVIMEIKVPDEQPAWLQALLEKYQIEKQSFSKYGNAYRLSQESKGGNGFADRIIF